MANSLSGTRIREQRQRFGISQTALAHRAGISTSYLNLIEHNKRRIGGKLLLDIARELEVPPSSLTEGADTDLINTLLEIAGQMPDHTPETAGLTAIAERFPGWSRLLAALYRKTKDQEVTIAALSDRLTHDPFLAESLHLMLSNITAIRSTASILKSVDDIEPAQSAQFHSAIHEESKRLSDATQALIAYFDKSPDQGEAQDDVGLAQLEADAKAMPREVFAASAAASGYNPSALASEFNVTLHGVFRRLASLKRDGRDGPAMGVIITNAAGQALHRSALPNFPLPRHGNACPLWPVFQGFSQPERPLQNLIELPSGAQFVTLTIALPRTSHQFGEMPDYRSAMLFIPKTLAESFGMWVQAPQTASLVGTSCRICPRTACPARAEALILEESGDTR